MDKKKIQELLKDSIIKGQVKPHSIPMARYIVDKDKFDKALQLLSASPWIEEFLNEGLKFDASKYKEIIDGDKPKCETCGDTGYQKDGVEVGLPCRDCPEQEKAEEFVKRVRSKLLDVALEVGGTENMAEPFQHLKIACEYIEQLEKDRDAHSNVRQRHLERLGRCCDKLANYEKGTKYLQTQLCQPEYKAIWDEFARIMKEKK